MAQIGVAALWEKQTPRNNIHPQHSRAPQSAIINLQPTIQHLIGLPSCSDDHHGKSHEARGRRWWMRKWEGETCAQSVPACTSKPSELLRISHQVRTVACRTKADSARLDLSSTTTYPPTWTRLPTSPLPRIRLHRYNQLHRDLATFVACSWAVRSLHVPPSPPTEQTWMNRTRMTSYTPSPCSLMN